MKTLVKICVFALVAVLVWSCGGSSVEKDLPLTSEQIEAELNQKKELEVAKLEKELWDNFKAGVLLSPKHEINLGKGNYFYLKEHGNTYKGWLVKGDATPEMIIEVSLDGLLWLEDDLDQKSITFVRTETVILVDLRDIEDFDIHTIAAEELGITSFGTYRTIQFNAEKGLVYFLPDTHPANPFRSDVFEVMALGSRMVTPMLTSRKFGSDFYFDAKTGWLIYSDYPHFVDVDAKEEWLSRKPRVSLMAQHLDTGFDYQMAKHDHTSFEITKDSGVVKYRHLGEWYSLPSFDVLMAYFNMNQPDKHGVLLWEETSEPKITLDMTVQEALDLYQVTLESASFNGFQSSTVGLIGNFHVFVDFGDEAIVNKRIRGIYYAGPSRLFGIEKGMPLSEVVATLGMPESLHWFGASELYSGLMSEFFEDGLIIKVEWTDHMTVNGLWVHETSSMLHFEEKDRYDVSEDLFVEIEGDQFITLYKSEKGRVLLAIESKLIYLLKRDAERPQLLLESPFLGYTVSGNEFGTTLIPVKPFSGW